MTIWLVVYPLLCRPDISLIEAAWSFWLSAIADFALSGRRSLLATFQQGPLLPRVGLSLHGALSMPVAFQPAFQDHLEMC